MEWRIPAALVAAAAVGLNAKVFFYGSLAQPYGMCLFALAMALRFAVGAGWRSFPETGRKNARSRVHALGRKASLRCASI
jgi:hypothetical protein